MQTAKQVRTVCFVGPSGSGKTTLIEQLIPLIQARNMRVAAVKATHHIVEPDHPGKDSWRLREAGAEEVFLVTPRHTIHTHVVNEVEELRVIVRRIRRGVELVLVEGFRSSLYPKVLVGESVASAISRGTKGAILAAVDVTREGSVEPEGVNLEALLEIILGASGSDKLVRPDEGVG
ncbi:MAG: molybdopterin-guanine dinucleotide biosynthesis protein B [Dehalococcoidia bacterium]|nr:molybdopterin-guanine dinucleotide biosynthesis protein B [Dehalococcoidia bacterium]